MLANDEELFICVGVPIFYDSSWTCLVALVIVYHRRAPWQSKEFLIEIGCCYLKF